MIEEKQEDAVPIILLAFYDTDKSNNILNTSYHLLFYGIPNPRPYISCNPHIAIR
jgi:hypothetical protein